ncbi:hypothetical protein LIA77_10373 [Sarocladium implicatum]|nr:hypothetical protein LIA77_10373 [Sarocladium implicatum]
MLYDVGDSERELRSTGASNTDAHIFLTNAQPRRFYSALETQLNIPWPWSPDPLHSLNCRVGVKPSPRQVMLVSFIVLPALHQPQSHHLSPKIAYCKGTGEGPSLQRLAATRPSSTKAGPGSSRLRLVALTSRSG